MQALGRHLLLELFDCDAEAINSLETVKTSMVEAGSMWPRTLSSSGLQSLACGSKK